LLFSLLLALGLLPLESAQQRFNKGWESAGTHFVSASGGVPKTIMMRRNWS
jgi:hypothetical protein